MMANSSLNSIPMWIGIFAGMLAGQTEASIASIKSGIGLSVQKNINPNEVLNSSSLKKLKLINKNSTKLKILGTGELKDKINIEADLASKSAIEKLEKIGGSIQLKK